MVAIDYRTAGGSAAAATYVNPYFGAMSAPTIDASNWRDINIWNTGPASANVVSLASIGSSLRLSTDGNWAKFDYVDDAAQTVGAGFEVGATDDFIWAVEMDHQRDRFCQTASPLLQINVGFVDTQAIGTYPVSAPVHLAHASSLLYANDSDLQSHCQRVEIGTTLGTSGALKEQLTTGSRSQWMVLQRSDNGTRLRLWSHVAGSRPLMLRPSLNPFVSTATAGLLFVVAHGQSPGHSGEVWFRETYLDSLPWGG